MSVKQSVVLIENIDGEASVSCEGERVEFKFEVGPVRFLALTSTKDAERLANSILQAIEASRAKKGRRRANH